jgi:hypothetical protein
VKRPLLAALSALLLAACNDAEQLAPVPVPTASPVDAGSDASPPSPSAVTVTPWVKRTVMTRNPYGGPPGNLLADGDFEFSTVGQQGAQLGWRAYTSDGSGTLNILTETGGLCRSGLRCALFQPGMILFLRGTAANGQGNVASLYGRMPFGAKCYDVRAILVDCDALAVHEILNTSTKPGPDGWCHYSASLAANPSALCLYIDNTLKEATYALLDNAEMGPDDGTVYPESAQAWVPDAALMSTLSNLRDLIHRTTPLARSSRPGLRPAEPGSAPGPARPRAQGDPW